MSYNSDLSNPGRRRFDRTLLSLSSIRAEMERAERLHGALPLDLSLRYLVLAREIGEVAEAVSEVSRLLKSRTITAPEYRSRLSHLGDELTQVAAVCVHWMDAIKEELE